MIAAIALVLLLAWAAAVVALAVDRQPGEDLRHWEARRRAEIQRKTTL